eukprot:4449159-Pyramimonas_sp.AAC.1
MEIFTTTVWTTEEYVSYSPNPVYSYAAGRRVGAIGNSRAVLCKRSGEADWLEYPSCKEAARQSTRIHCERHDPPQHHRAQRDRLWQHQRSSARASGNTILSSTTEPSSTIASHTPASSSTVVS